MTQTAAPHDAVAGATASSSPSPAPALPVTPYTIVIDTREQRHYSFESPLKRQRKLYQVATARGTLTSGDYSLAGFESRVAVERKSPQDLFSTLGHGRARFARELERLSVFDLAAVVVEAEWSRLLTDPPERSMLDPRTVFHSVVAWTVRHPRVHWFFVPGREMGEVTTARLLDWFHRTHGDASR